MSNSIVINKSRVRLKQRNHVHCSKNSIKITGLLFCWKCVEDKTKKGRNKKFTNCRQLFHHLTITHSNSDLNEYPTRDNCIKMLQTISDAIITGVLK